MGEPSQRLLIKFLLVMNKFKMKIFAATDKTTTNENYKTHHAIYIFRTTTATNENENM